MELHPQSDHYAAESQLILMNYRTFLYMTPLSLHLYLLS